MTFIEETIRKNYKIRYIGLFGSRARNNSFLNSDVDLILLGSLSEDIRKIKDRVVSHFTAPNADI